MCLNSDEPIYRQVFNEFKKKHPAEYDRFRTIVENTVFPRIQARMEFDTHSLGREVLPHVDEDIKLLIHEIWASKEKTTGREVARVFGGIVVSIVNPGTNGWVKIKFKTGIKDENGIPIEASRYSWKGNASS